MNANLILGLAFLIHWRLGALVLILLGVGGLDKIIEIIRRLLKL